MHNIIHYTFLQILSSILNVKLALMILWFSAEHCCCNKLSFMKSLVRTMRSILQCGVIQTYKGQLQVILVLSRDRTYSTQHLQGVC